MLLEYPRYRLSQIQRHKSDRSRDIESTVLWFKLVTRRRRNKWFLFAVINSWVTKPL